MLTHLQPWTNPDDTRAEAVAAFAGDLEIAVAGQVIDLALTPSVSIAPSTR